MPISDLTNTTWLFNESVSRLGSMSNLYTINFTSNGNSYTQIGCGKDSDYMSTYVTYNSTKVYLESIYDWTNEAYRTINITGGTDVTNSTLISWLEANAVQSIPVAGTISKIQLPNGDIYEIAPEKLKSGDYFASAPTLSANATLATEGFVNAAIEALPEPMIFKGSVGTGGTVTWANLPAASSSNEGFTYKVITDHATAPICKVGDTIISNGSSWVVIPSGDEPSGTVTSVGISMPTGFTVTGSPVTSSGTMTVTFASGYSLPTDVKQGEWDAKYQKPANGIPGTDLEDNYALASDLASVTDLR